MAASSEQAKANDAEVVELTKAKLSSEIAKLDLERRKLEADVRDAERPWHRRPSSVTTVLPTLLAIGTLLVAWKRGYFDVEKTRLENSKWDLQRAVDTLNTQKTALRQDSVRVAQLRSGLAMESESLRVVGTQVRQDRDRLEQEHRTLATRIESERRRADSLVALTRRSSEEELVQSHVAEVMRDPERISAMSAPVTAMTDMLRKRDARAATLERMLVSRLGDTSLPAVPRAAYCYTLYQGTHAIRWRQCVDSLLQDAVSSIIAGRTRYYEHFWLFNSMASGSWSDADRRALALLLVQQLRRIDAMQPLSESPDRRRETTIGLLSTLNQFVRNGIQRDSLLDGDGRDLLFAVAQARSLLMTASTNERGIEISDRSAVYALSRLAPPCFLVVVGTILADESSAWSSVARHQLLEDALRVAEYDLQLDSTAVPRTTDSRVWREWLAAHARAVRTWSASDLSSLDPDPARVRTLMESLDPPS